MERRVNAPDKDWLTEEEAAAWLDVGVPMLRSMINSGDFPPPFRVGPKGKMKKWHWMDVVAYAHMATRMAQKPDEKPREKAKGN